MPYVLLYWSCVCTDSIVLWSILRLMSSLLAPSGICMVFWCSGDILFFIIFQRFSAQVILSCIPVLFQCYSRLSILMFVWISGCMVVHLGAPTVQNGANDLKLVFLSFQWVRWILAKLSVLWEEISEVVYLKVGSQYRSAHSVPLFRDVLPPDHMAPCLTRVIMLWWTFHMDSKPVPPMAVYPTSFTS